MKREEREVFFAGFRGVGSQAVVSWRNRIETEVPLRVGLGCEFLRVIFVFEGEGSVVNWLIFCVEESAFDDGGGVWGFFLAVNWG